MVVEDKDEKLKEVLKEVTSFINHLSETDKNQERNLIQEILNIREEVIDDIKKEIIKIRDEDIKDISLSEFHVIECIGKNNMTNNIFMVKKLNMTKGGISKINSRLLSKEIIKAEKLENNKKEIYYSLTEKGIALFKLHEYLHKKEEEKLIKILDSYKHEEITTILKFLNDLKKVI